MILKVFLNLVVLEDRFVLMEWSLRTIPVFLGIVTTFEVNREG